MARLDSNALKKIGFIMKDADAQATPIDKIVNNLMKRLDFVDECINKYEEMLLNKPTTQELEEIILTIPTQLYYAGEEMESMGIREDIMKAIKAEMYNKHYDEEAKGTVADKKATAELEVQTETITHSIYARTYKLMKYKIDAALNILNSAKKVYDSKRDKVSADFDEARKKRLHKGD